MKTKNNKISAFLLFLALGLMLVPAFVKHYGLYKGSKLYGVVTPVNDTVLSANGWFDGSYADHKGKYLNDNFGFRNWFVKLRNQMYYSAFGKLFAYGAVKGKSGFVFEKGYLEAYSGKDYVGDSITNATFEKLKFIQDSLIAKGVLFIVVFAPSQANFYPEYIPDSYKASSSTNYLKYLEAARKLGINYIDFNNWFAAMRNKSAYPLYSKAGSHWTTYGAYVAFDSLNGYIESRLHKKLPRFNYSNVIMSDSLMYEDGDLTQGLNLFENIAPVKLAYPIAKWGDTSHCFRPRFLGIGDSYLKRFYDLKLLNTAYDRPAFWYYYQEFFDYKPLTGRIDPGDIDLKSYVERQNVVVLMASEITLQRFGWNFIDDMYATYKMGTAAYNKTLQYRKRNYELKKYMFSIANTPSWYAYVKQKAQAENISVDSALKANAYFMYQEHIRDWYQSMNIKLDAIIEKILADKNWLELVKNQADEKHISLDSCLRLNAVYEYAQAHKNDQDYARQVAIENLVKYIYTDQTWLTQIKKQSADLDIPLDSCIRANAIFVVDSKAKGN
jgi:hypothetical protein